jgi:hypothetical protein
MTAATETAVRADIDIENACVVFVAAPDPTHLDSCRVVTVGGDGAQAAATEAAARADVNLFPWNACVYRWE